MAKKLCLALIIGCVLLSCSQLALGQEDGWIELFDGTLNGWKVNEENPETFSVRDGMIVVDGSRSHLFYDGPVNNANFKNFELKVEVMTKPNANSGIYFHTEYQEDGWPDKGFEVQVNNTHSDWRKSGGLYGIQDVRESQQDNEWFTEHIIVRGKHVITKINGKTKVDWTEPEDWNNSGRRISSGTFALQGHDPKSVIYYRSVKVKPLPLEEDEPRDGWISLFDGKSFNGWKARENKDTFSIRDDMIVVDGPRSHLFYTGPVNNANFKNFELKAEVMTRPSANSGIYFHTKYQESGWPAKGYEVQVNNSHGDWRKSGSLWAIQDVREEVNDNEWFTEHIIVKGKHIVIKVNGKTTVDWIEPENFEPPSGMSGRKISSGTFALQGHDPKSVIFYKNIRVRPLSEKEKIKVVVLTGGHGFEREQFFKMFESYGDVEYTEFQLKDHSEIFEDVSDWDYDVIVAYNMTQEISQKRRQNFARLLKRQGVGFVAMHHTMGAFQEWPQYRKITGGKYYLKASDDHRGSTYKHDIDMNVHIVDTSHPITKGINDFQIHDEGYKYLGFEKNNHVLFTANHPESDETIGWVRNFGKAKVCGIMLGHDHYAFENPNFRKLVARAIRWTAGRLD
jgi:type 1 glutamine amidotransferase